ncbi:MAG: ABC transporter substrate-binding protein, partial [Bifidobacteriaceae bacterium]|nr:ABC transporter substrate-binding protein [Bifidobacteriaceae bacterium]
MKSQENGVHVGISATNKTQYSDDNVRVELESLDESLNVKRKKPNGRKTNRLILAVIAIVAVIFAAVIGVNVINNNSKKRSDTLNIVLKLAPTNLDIRTQSGSSLDQVLIGNVYEGLVARNEENKVVPALAKSWDVSEDGLTYTFHMAKSAHFSNGKTLDAYTAAASIQQLIDKQYRDYDKLSAVQTITALDPTTLKFQLKTPDANLLWNLTGRAGLVLEPTATNDLKTSAIGSGPYVVKKFVNNSSIQLQANSQYWGNHAAKT